MSADSLPPTQYLVMEVLAARHRLGEWYWSFPQTCRKPINALADAGLVHVVKESNVVGCIMARLTDKGREDWLSDTYEPPLLGHRVPAAKPTPDENPMPRRFHLFRRTR